jgi:uroporphyrinogen-III decarboxylase
VLRSYYQGIADSGQRMPIGTDLVLFEEADPEEARRDGQRLGRIVEASARRYRTPLAVPLMDLRLEKADLLGRIGVAADEVDSYHFHEAPGDDVMEAADRSAGTPFPVASQAHFDAIRYIAEHTDLCPIGMLIGPFSLMTKLLADPIIAVAMAGMGLSAEEDPGVKLAERALALAEKAVSRSTQAHIEAGAKAIIVCEPAANVVYISPKMLAGGSDIFERYVLEPNLRLRQQMADADVDLIFHNCGELVDTMVEQFVSRLDPAIISFGSSRNLWEDARLIPKHIVMFGNLPTKTFYSDAQMPAEEVKRLTCELITKMRATGHPHILGSECDVLYVPDAAETIKRKVDVMLNCSCG